MASFPVKWYFSQFPAAPKLDGTPGSFINVLDAILVNGFASSAINSIVVENKKATITIQEKYKYFVNSVVEITGLPDLALNGQYRVLESYDGKLIVSMEHGNGSIAFTTANIKTPSLGWTKPFSGVNKAVYMHADPNAFPWYYVVNDDNGKFVEIAIAENAFSVDSFDNKKPYDFKAYWLKSHLANTNRANYVFVGDSQAIYYRALGIQSNYSEAVVNLSKGAGITYFLGKPINNLPVVDNFDVCFTCIPNINSGNSEHTFFRSLYLNSSNSAANNFYNNSDTLRNAYGLKVTCNLGSKEETASSNSLGTTFSPFSSNDYYSSDGAIVVRKGFKYHDGTKRIREFPGIYLPFIYTKEKNFPSFIKSVDNPYKKEFIILHEVRTDSSIYTNGNGFTSPISPYYNETFFLDITGPWR